jgi:guanosine-3',5'-bis(diphosphate) 3'-pyrophosphohydrolase
MHEEILDIIIEFTDKAHGEQTRKYSPDRYIVHPVRVMKICAKYNHELPVLAAAILHDVLEDTPVTEQQMREFLSTLMDEEQAIKTVKLVKELTDVYIKEDYPQFNRRKRKQLESDRMAKTSAYAQTIKYADILDNAEEIAKDDPDFARVFLRECRNLMKVMTDGHPELKKITIESLDKKLDSLKR